MLDFNEWKYRYLTGLPLQLSLRNDTIIGWSSYLICKCSYACQDPLITAAISTTTASGIMVLSLASATGSHLFRLFSLQNIKKNKDKLDACKNEMTNSL